MTSPPKTDREYAYFQAVGVDDPKEISSALQLEPKRDGLFRIREKFKTQFVCVGFYYQSFSWELDFELQRRATALGIGFWFDTYSYGDYHEEIVELREQLGIRKGRD